MDEQTELRSIIRWQLIGLVASIIAKRLQTTPVKGLQLYFKSRVCEKLKDESTGLYLYGPEYIADEVFQVF